jgi:hypothetical protein
MARLVFGASCGRSIAEPSSIPIPFARRSKEGSSSASRRSNITLKHGRVETNFDSYQIPRMDEAPTIRIHIVQNAVTRRHRRSRDFGYRSCGLQCDHCGNRQALANLLLCVGS